MAAKAFAQIVQLARVYGEKPIAEACGLPRSTIRKLADGHAVRTKLAPGEINRRLQLFMLRQARALAERRRLLSALRDVVLREGGIRPAARVLDADPSNLAKKLRAPLN